MDLTLVLQSVGVIVFAFQEKKWETDNHQDLLEKAALVLKIGMHEQKENEEEIPGIHLVNLIFGNEENLLSTIAKYELGYLLNLSLTYDNLNDASSLQTYLTTAFRELHSLASLPSSSIWLNQFTARLYLLQNLESEEMLMHQRIVQQNFGSPGFCIWTKGQKKILDAAREEFAGIENRELNQPPIHWAICGGYGAGKTLLMMQMARDFVKLNDSGVALICIPRKRECLYQRLKENLKKLDNKERSRIAVATQQIDNRFEKVGEDSDLDKHGIRIEIPELNKPIIVWQEEKSVPAWRMRLMEVPLLLFQDEDFFWHHEEKHQLMKQTVSNSPNPIHNITLLTGTMDNDASKYQRVFTLKEGNLRSSYEISNFITDFRPYPEKDQNMTITDVNGSWTTTTLLYSAIPVVAGISTKAKPVEVYAYLSNTKLVDGNLFWQHCQSKISRLLGKKNGIETLGIFIYFFL